MHFRRLAIDSQYKKNNIYTCRSLGTALKEAFNFKYYYIRVYFCKYSKNAYLLRRFLHKFNRFFIILPKL